MQRYTPAQRQYTLERLLDILRTDSRLAGVLLVGSAAHGFTDDYSDIDLAVVVEKPEDVKPAFDDLGAAIAENFDVLIWSPVPRGENVFLYAMLLSGYLEVDASFQCLDDLSARRKSWHVAWDRTDRIAGLMKASWQARTAPDSTPIFRRLMEDTWHLVNHVGLSAVRGQMWRAICDLETIRDSVVTLSGLRLNLDTVRFREADALPPELITALAGTLVQRPETGEILRALRITVGLFNQEAHALAAAHALEYPPVPDKLLLELVDLWEGEAAS